jgi:hypothetical protein
MPTVIDSLLVKLGLDTSDFDAKKGKVDTKLKDTSKGAKDTQRSFDEVAKAATKFLAILGGTVAVKRFVTDMIETNAALDRLSRNLKESANNVSAWSNAAEIAGGTASGLQGTMDMLSRSQTELQLTGQSGLIPYFTALGISLADTQGRARPVSELLLALSDRFGRMDRTTANNMGRMMGVDEGTMQLLLKGRGEVELMLKRQREYNAVTKQQAEESSRLRVAMVESRQSFAAFGRELVSAATPALEKMFSVLAAFGDWARQNKEFVQTFLKIIAVGLGAIAVSLVPINLVVVAVLALAAGIAALWQDFQVWQRGGDSLLPWGKWVPGINKAIEAIVKLRNTLMDAGFRMAAFLTMTYKFATGDRKGAKQAARALVKGMAASLKEDADANGGPQADPSRMSAKDYFISRGWSPAQAAGLAANLQRESGMDPNAVGDNGKAYGLAQWHPDRQAAFAKWAGKDIRNSSREEQLAFVHYELTQGGEQAAGAALRNAITAQRAGELVSRLYERPAASDAEAKSRGMLARAMMFGIPGASMLASGAGAATSADARAPRGGSSSSVVETNIGTITVHTAATDADGIAKDMGKSMQYLFASQANGGGD